MESITCPFCNVAGQPDTNGSLCCAAGCITRWTWTPAEPLYLVTRGDRGILVQAPNAGQAYERAIGYGFTPNLWNRPQAKVTRLDGVNPAGYTLNKVRSRTDINPTRKGH